MGLFIVFEGGEGSGKSTQAKALTRKLDRLGFQVILVHEPGSTALGIEISRSLKKKRHEPVSPETELLLFAACRAQMVTDILRPSLEADRIVIADRFTASTLAYQGYGRGISLETIAVINHLATQGLKPNLTILLDIAAETGLKRKGMRRDRFEVEAISFHERVRKGYLEMASKEPQEWLVIDATLPKGKIAGIVWEKVSPLLSSKKGIVRHA